MHYRDLREFIAALERRGELRRLREPVSPRLEMTALCDALLRAGGPALLVEPHAGAAMPMLGNLFGSQQRIALALGQENVSELRRIGQVLAHLKAPEPPRGLKGAAQIWEMARALWHMRPTTIKRAPCREEVWTEIDLTRLPVWTCWPEDAAPLITWGLVITRSAQSVAAPKRRQNLGIYRQQIIGKNRVIMRWLSHRGGAQDFRHFALANPGQPFPIAVALGADPATILGAVTPVPDELSEYQFAGLLRGAATELSDCEVGEGLKLQAPASAEIVLEGHIPPAPLGFNGASETGAKLREQGGYLHALEGPFGDHTGYYNEQDWFPVFEVTRITSRAQPIYHSTYTGKPPDEPSMLGLALGEVFTPILQKQFSEIADFYLPAEACSYRLGIVSIRKAYAGHARRVMMALWSFLRQFLYTKFLIVVDDDIDVRNWSEVVWAVSTRVDPVRDTVLMDNTPIDYLDFASPISGLGGKLGLDATHKWPGETQRPWGRTITPDAAAQARARGWMEEILNPLQNQLDVSNQINEAIRPQTLSRR